jgi:hypothetical protein
MPRRAPQSALSKALLDRLFNQCNWAHEVWTLRRALFEGNRRKRTLERGPHMYFLATVNTALTEYVLLQIAKLHDPAVVSGRVSLTIEYVVEYGGWDASSRRKLLRLKERLDALGKQIRPARNRLIAHNDLAAVLGDTALGAFEEGADRKYFRALQSFITTVYRSATGEPCAAFATFSRDDAHQVIAALASSTRGENGSRNH